MKQLHESSQTLYVTYNKNIQLSFIIATELFQAADFHIAFSTAPWATSINEQRPYPWFRRTSVIRCSMCARLWLRLIARHIWNQNIYIRINLMSTYRVMVGFPNQKAGFDDQGSWQPKEVDSSAMFVNQKFWNRQMKDINQALSTKHHGFVK